MRINVKKPGNTFGFIQGLKIISLWLLITRLSVFAQPDYIRFDRIGLEDGLSQSTVNAIVQDAQGFMWFGTQDGLNRYDGYSIKVFKHDPNDPNSISDNTVWSLMCDSRGDLWIGTERGGLNRYVSSENKFYHFMNKEDDYSSISDNFIISLFEDSRRNIWAGTLNSGVNLLTRDEGSFSRFLYDKEDGGKLTASSIRKICEDSLGNLWFATQRGLYKFRLDELYNSTSPRFVHYKNFPQDPNSLSNNNLRGLYLDPKGVLWIGTSGGGLNSFDQKTGTFSRYINDKKNPASISGNLVTSIYGDPYRPGPGLLIGTYDAGLNLYNSSTNKFNRYIKTESILTLYEDRSGILWIGTLSGGIKIFDRRKNNFIHYFDDPDNTNDLFGNMILAILEDRDSELWVAAMGYGLNRFDYQRKIIKVYTNDPKNDNSLTSNLIVALCESSDGSIWAGTIEGGIERFDKKNNKFTRYKHDPKNSNSILNNAVSALYYDKESDIMWIGYSIGGVSKYNISENIFEHFIPDKDNPDAISKGPVSTIYKGKRTGLWIGTIDRGLNRYITRSGHSHSGYFKHYQVSAEPAVNNNGIQTIYEDDKGIIWIGTYGGGLNRYDPTAQSFKYYTEKDGLPNNVIYSILPDKEGFLWLSTNKGISRFDRKAESFRNYDVSDGLQSNEFNQGASFATANGELFFGGVNGFNSFFPGEIEDNKYIPPVYLTTFKVFDEMLSLPNPLPRDTRIELTYAQNFFSFEFVALNYTASEKNQYAYILEGFDENWHLTSSQRRYVSYTNLDPGEYLLRVRGSNNNGIWNKEGTLCTIIIKPPIWMTLWFRILLGSAIIIFTIVFYNYRIHKIRKMDLMRLRIARDLHDEVGSDLGGIGLISQRLEKYKGISYDIKSELSEISRASFQTSEKLRDIVWFVNPEHDKSEHLILRIKDLAGSLLKDVEYIFFIDNKVTFQKFDLEARRQLYLIIKEIFYNIIQHASATKVEIRFEQDSRNLKIIICDNGKGFDSTEELENSRNDAMSNGMGLKNIHRRAELIKAKVDIQSKEGCGTTFTISVHFP